MIFIADENTMGYIEERPSGDGKKMTYRVQIRLKGHQKLTKSFDLITHAKRWMHRTEAEIKEGRYFKTLESQKRTLGELIDRYIKEVLPKKPKNAHNVETTFSGGKRRLDIFIWLMLRPI